MPDIVYHSLQERDDMTWTRFTKQAQTYLDGYEVSMLADIGLIKEPH